MKKTFFLFAVIGLALLSCKKTGSDNSIPASLDGTWRMILVKEIASGLLTTKPGSIRGDVDITFTSAGPVNGSFTGNTPTNDIWQSDYSTGPNNSLTIPFLSMTKVMETSWGKEFVDNICNARTYRFESGGRVNIETTNKTLTFQKL